MVRKLVFACIVLTALARLAVGQGLAGPPELRQTLGALVAHVNRLKPILDQVKPQDWLAQGAPSTYVEQWKSVQAEAGFVVRNADELSRDPERMTKTLELYLRLESIETMVDSLAGGIRRYQNPAVADLLEGMLAESNPYSGKLRNYLMELTATKEAELGVMDAEAQRCRSMLIKSSAPKPVPQKAAPKP